MQSKYTHFHTVRENIGLICRLNLVDSSEIAGICFYPPAFGRLEITTADISGVNNRQTDWKILSQKTQSGPLLLQT